MTRHGAFVAAALLAFPAIATAHGDPLVFLLPPALELLKLAAVVFTLVVVAVAPAAVASLASLVVAVVARLSRVRLRFLLEWVLRAFVLSYAVLAAAVLIVWPTAARLVDGHGAPVAVGQTDRWFVAIQASGWVCLTVYLALIPVPMIALLVAFFARRRAYREITA